MEKEYKITKEECQLNIDKSRVCTRCGSKLEPIETIDNSGDPTYWQGCKDCMVFDNGTSPEIYITASRMVDERSFVPYTFEDIPDKVKEPLRFDYWRKNQISGTVRIVTDMLRIHGVI